MVVILNGASSSGKTSIAKHLFEIADVPFLFFSHDFLNTVILPDPISFDTVVESGPGFERSFVRKQNNRMWRMLAPDEVLISLCEAFVETIRAYAQRGFNCLVEDVILDDNRLRLYVDYLSGIDVAFVGLYCGDSELQSRERNRGDRWIGQAVQQNSVVHRHGLYDLTVNTSKIDPSECAQQILDYVGGKPRPSAFRRLAELFASDTATEQ